MDNIESDDHSKFADNFGDLVAKALVANSDGYYGPTNVVRVFLQSLLNGVTPVEDSPFGPMPEDFRKFMNDSRSFNHFPNDYLQGIWKSRVHERFVESENWLQWPNQEWSSTTTSIDSGKHVFVPAYGQSSYFFNESKDILIHISVHMNGDLDIDFYTDRSREVDSVISEVENYVILPDPYESKIIRLDEDSVKVLSFESMEISGYSEEVEEAVAWLSSIADSTVREKLSSVGLPSRAGLLLEGPPGSGKTTLARRIAADLSAKDCTVIYATPTVDIEEVFAFSNRYEPALIILEDVESFFGERGNSDFSSFLNELDGLDQTAGKMIIATSNDSSEFDEAIRRPGRLERRAVIADVQPDAHFNMISLRLPGESKETVKNLVTIVKAKMADKSVTPAVLDSLARHAIMLNLTDSDLIDYVQNNWEPSYDGSNYIG